MSANHQENHVASISTYVGVFLALVFLTIVTIFISVGFTHFGIDLGAYSIVLALGVASLKAILVGAIFMHLWHEDRLIILILLTTALFIALFFGMVSLDVTSRGAINPTEDNMTLRNAIGSGLVIDAPAHDAHDTAAEAPAAAPEEAPAAE